MVDRGADQRQAQGDIDAAPEGRVFQHGQALVVVHGQHAIGVGQVFVLEQGVGRVRSARIDAARLRRGDCRGDHIDFFASQVTALARMRIQAGHQDARRGDAEFPLQVRLNDIEGDGQAVQGDGSGHVLQGQMRGGQRHAQGRFAMARFAGQHHHHLRCVGFFCQVFRMAGKGHAGVVDRALLQGRRDHGAKPAGGDTFHGRVQGRQHGAPVFLVEYARNDIVDSRDIDHGQAAGAEMRQAVVAHGLQRQRRQADLRIDQAGRQRQVGSVAQQDAVDFIAHGPGRAYGDFRADTGRFATGNGDGRAA